MVERKSHKKATQMEMVQFGGDDDDDAKDGIS